MTGSEPGRQDAAAPTDWRSPLRADQRALMPAGPTVVSGNARYGNAGLGRHLQELVEAARDRETLAAYLALRAAPGDEGGPARTVESSRVAALLLKSPVAQLSPSLKVHLRNDGFDSAGSRLLPDSAEHLLVFNGHAHHHSSRARRLGYRSVGLISANSHLERVARQHRLAYEQYPLERPWGMRPRPRSIREYAEVDLVYVSSRYAWASFVEAGVSEERLALWPLTPDDRFRPRSVPPAADTFNVVYVGSLSVHKGVPLLIDAVRRLSQPDLRLVLVGGYGTPGMRRFVESARAADRRIVLSPGDPVAHFAEAGVCVHPSFEEGYGYAPAEASACGVPLIVSEDSAVITEYRPDLESCRVVRTGHLDELTGAIEAAYAGWHAP